MRDSLTKLVLVLQPLDSARAVTRVDAARGFLYLSNDGSLQHLNVTIELDHVKSKKHNPVAEKIMR